MQADTLEMMREIEDKHWWFVGRRAILESFLDRLNLTPDSRILEVGCGTGGNIELLTKFGGVQCVEVDPVAAGLARNRNKAPVFPGKLPNDIPEFEHPFELITIFDVIEHVDEDSLSLASLATMLSSGGRILVTVPAFNFLWSKHDDENQHKRRYRRKDLLELARENGLKADYVSYFNFWLFPPVAAVRLIRKIFPYEESWKDMRMPNKMVNGVLRWMFSSERHLLKKSTLPFGISLIAVLSLPDTENQ